MDDWSNIVFAVIVWGLVWFLWLGFLTASITVIVKRKKSDDD